MKGIWNNSEVKELFERVEDYKDKNKSLKLAFVAHAEKFGRKPNSVRNYYYHEVDNLKVDGKRLQKLGIDLKRHSKTCVTYFSPEEEKDLMKEVDDMVQKGISVRKACLTLSGGDVSQMLRYQNKYRNFIAKNKKKDEKKAVLTQNTAKPDNVIAFRKTGKLLTDGEIQSLFMGLVRLVKKNAQEESEEAFKEKLGRANNDLRKAIAKLGTNQRENEKLKEELDKVRSENSRLLNLNLQLRCDRAEGLRQKLQKKEKSE
ncbi:MAG: hypothetical protein HFI85_00645 [Clostridia bacterium]|jgi:hypothetical protein|nr:hypothetical protein [Clostridia bacterium]